MPFVKTRLLAFLLSFSTGLSAQVAGVPQEVKVLKMPKFSIGNFPKKSIPVSRIAFLQNVWDSVTLGYVQKGVDGQVALLQPSKPLTAFLQDQFNKIYKDGFKPGGAVLLFVVKDLRVSERSFFSKQMAYTRVNADAYISFDGTGFLLAAAIDSVLLEPSGVDVTNWHGQRIENVFRLLLANTFKNAKFLDQQASQYSIKQIGQTMKHDLDFPILNSLSYQEGLYKNFQEFLNDKPGTTNYLPVLIDRKKLKFITANENNQMDTLQAWGICKEGEIYKYHEGSLVPIEKYRNGFIISDHVQKVNRRNSQRNSDMLFAGAVGGLVGALIVSVVQSNRSSTPIQLVTSIPYIKKNYPEASCIDMKTGELTF